MKYFILVPALLCVLTLNSQKSNYHIIKTIPFATGNGWINSSYETNLSNNGALMLFADIVLINVDLISPGFVFGSGYRHYIGGRENPDPNGLFVQPEARYMIGNNQNDGSFGLVGFELGYQKIWATGLGIDLGIGPAYYTQKIFSDQSIAPIATAALAYKFSE
ncbi:MAG: hypothetical protein R3275_04780 [Saprospiraceae bacterium]|nr:hypothetical protein [Saprospiraceae bacterium]